MPSEQDDRLLLAPSEMDSLCKIGAIRRFKRGATIFWQGDAGDSLYAVLTGSVKVYGTSEDGRSRIFRILGPLEVFGEIAFLDRGPRTATVETLEASRICATPKDAFDRYARRHPELLSKIQKIVCARVRQHTAEILDLSYRDVDHRLACLFLDLAERFGQQQEEGVLIAPPLSQRDLAGLLGCHRETVTRSLAKLQERGRVSTRGRRFCIPDVGSLLEEIRRRPSAG